MPTRRPNILLVILDTLRRDRLSHYGADRPTSPRFDEFASDSVTFTRAVAPAQWTVPSHTSMFTGLYPSEHGVTQSNSVLSGMQPTLAELLRGGGYHTVAFCNNPLVGVLNHGLTRGYDRFYNYASAIPDRPYDHELNPLYHEFTRRFRPTARKIGNWFAHSDTAFRVALHPMFVPLWAKWINFKGNTAVSIDDLIRYWKDHTAGTIPHRTGDDRPLFAFLNLMGAHTPYQPPLDFLNKIAPEVKNDKRAFAFMRHFNADGAAWAAPPEKPLEPWQINTLNAFYDAEIAYQDHQLGRLLEFLHASGELENTVVIIAADHGEMHGEHDYFGHGFSVHQELVHVPLVIRTPDTPPKQIDTNVSTRRLFHTILDFAGVDPLLPPDDPNARVRDLSLAGVLHGDYDGEGNTAFSEAVPPMLFVHVLEHRSPAVIERLRLRDVRRTIYDGDLKLMTVGDGDDLHVEALYNVADDPAEANPLPAEENSLPKSSPLAMQDDLARVKALKKKLAAFAGAAVLNDAEESTAREVDDAAVMAQLRALGYMD